MPGQGRPSKPLEVKRITGTLRADRLPVNAPMSELHESAKIPEPSNALHFTGLVFWQKVWGLPWLSKVSDYALVSLTAEQLDERDIVRAILEDNQHDYKARSALRDLERSITSNLAALGLSPSERSRMGLAEVKIERKIDYFLAAAAERRASYKG